MSGNSIGKLFKLTTFGESHGTGIGGIIDGCPPGFEFDIAMMQQQLDRRRPGKSKYTTQRNESDIVEVYSGIFEGKTTGTPIGFFIRNQDCRSQDYAEIKDLFRPGHADFSYTKKYGFRDYRGGGRSSARETASRVAAGALAQEILKVNYGIKITAWVGQIGTTSAPHYLDKSFSKAEINNNDFFCPHSSTANKFAELITAIRKQRDSIGAKVCVLVENAPAGIGEPVFERLDSQISQALMSINAAKAVNIGDGFSCVTMKGSEFRDEMDESGFLSNHSGGILGGISTGEEIYAEVAFKPTSSIPKLGKTIDINGINTTITVKGRHDPCVGIRAVPIVEAMTALVILDYALINKALL